MTARIDVAALARSMSRKELEDAFCKTAENVMHLVDVIKERRPDALGPGVSAFGAAITIIEGVTVASSMEDLARVGDELLHRLVLVAMDIVIDLPWSKQPQHVRDAVCVLFAMVRNRTAGVVPTK